MFPALFYPAYSTCELSFRRFILFPHISLSFIIEPKPFFVAHDKRYEVFLSSEENNNSSKLRGKEVICLWNNHDFLVGQIERMTTIPTRGKNTHPLFDWKISKTDHVRLVVN